MYVCMYALQLHKTIISGLRLKNIRMLELCLKYSSVALVYHLPIIAKQVTKNCLG